MIRLNALAPSQLEFQPAAGAWSLLQVLEHLVLSEQALLQGARRKLTQPSRPVTPRENIMAFVVRRVMNSSIRVKTPAKASHVIPQSKKSFDALRGEWSLTRDEWEQFLEGLTPEWRTSALFRHPVSGGMTPTQTLRFVRCHLDHHQRQIDRLIESSSNLPQAVSA